jgi:hypothetical protein
MGSLTDDRHSCITGITVQWRLRYAPLRSRGNGEDILALQVIYQRSGYMERTAGYYREGSGVTRHGYTMITERFKVSKAVTMKNAVF